MPATWRHSFVPTSLLTTMTTVQGCWSACSFTKNCFITSLKSSPKCARNTTIATPIKLNTTSTSSEHKQRDRTCDGRGVEKSIDLQPRMRGSHSSGTFRSTLKYPSILRFCPANPEPWSPTKWRHLVRWIRFADWLAVFIPRDVSRYLFTAQPALEDDWFIFEHCDVVIETDFELGHWTRT